jgi:hypothetical protein
MPLLSKSSAVKWLLLAGTFFVSTPSCWSEEEPSETWGRAYSWLQTGERLAANEQWALAMGSYIETFRQMKAIREAHPSYEPELVNYRIDRLGEMIEETEPKLPPGGNSITMKFLDFIESYDLGMRQRFSNQYSESLGTLDIAKVILDEIIYENPEEFRDAVDTQYSIMHESIEWLEQQITYRARKPRSAYTSDGVDWGTTEFVKEKDLPADGDNILMSGSLFSRGPDPSQVRGLTTIPELEKNDGEKEESREEGEDDQKLGLRGFRMSSKQKESPEGE